ncbi:type VI secretion system protein TssA [Niveibacterium sp. SC-1]|uniref:type VI secretion system protein TssA n=1 Tax=Niveibacterium sp. SC-1 TaxID=3135646 RepID=UPI00311F5E15
MEAEALLQPISPDQPAGEDLSFSVEFDTIREARREDDPSLDQGEWVTAIKEAQWGDVVSVSSRLLETRSKDLRLAGWLAEGLAKTEGIAGLAKGLTVLAGLVEGFWDHVHPETDGEDLEERVGALAWFLTRGRQLLVEFPLSDHKGRRYGLAVLRAAQDWQKQGPEGASDESRVSIQQFREAQRATSKVFLDEQRQQGRAALAQFDRLSTATDARLGLEGPSFSAMREVFEEYLAELDQAAPAQGGAGKLAAQTPAAPPGGDDAPSEVAMPVDGTIRSRAQALEQLRTVARFFRETEPHSPVAYLADKAARWGEMPLHVWLKAVLRENDAMGRFEDLLGIEGESGLVPEE